MDVTLFYFFLFYLFVFQILLLKLNELISLAHK